MSARGRGHQDDRCMRDLAVPSRSPARDPGHSGASTLLRINMCHVHIHFSDVRAPQDTGSGPQRMTALPVGAPGASHCSETQHLALGRPRGSPQLPLWLRVPLGHCVSPRSRFLALRVASVFQGPRHRLFPPPETCFLPGPASVTHISHLHHLQLGQPPRCLHLLAETSDPAFPRSPPHTRDSRLWL